MASTAWKDLERKVCNHFKDIRGDSQDLEEIVRRNVRGNDFSQKDSDVDVLNLQRLHPYSLVIDCKYRTNANMWLPDIFKTEYAKFKKLELSCLFVMTAWLPDDGDFLPYYCIRLEDSLDILGSLSVVTSEPWKLYSTHVRARKNNKFLQGVIKKIETEYLPLKEDENESDFELIPVVAQRARGSKDVVLVIPAEYM